MTDINLIKLLKQDWFKDNEVDSILRWLENIKNWNTISYEEVKKLSREKIFSKQIVYV